jgi:hypothetical protein
MMWQTREDTCKLSTLRPPVKLTSTTKIDTNHAAHSRPPHLAAQLPNSIKFPRNLSTSLPLPSSVILTKAAFLCSHTDEALPLRQPQLANEKFGVIFTFMHATSHPSRMRALATARKGLP